jgi:hypothetical protein
MKGDSTPITDSFVDNCAFVDENVTLTLSSSRPHVGGNPTYFAGNAIMTVLNWRT